MELNFVRIKDSSSASFSEAMDLYRVSFPIYEQRYFRNQMQILEKSDYHFCSIYEGEKFVGILLYWETCTSIYIEHFAIKSQLRGKNYGSEALKLLIRDSSKTVILEIDPPKDEISVRRKYFYERVGFVCNPYINIHPPYRKYFSGHSLIVMSYPSLLTAIMYNDFVSYLKSICIP